MRRSGWTPQRPVDYAAAEDGLHQAQLIEVRSVLLRARPALTATASEPWLPAAWTKVHLRVSHKTLDDRGREETGCLGRKVPVRGHERLDSGNGRCLATQKRFSPTSRPGQQPSMNLLAKGGRCACSELRARVLLFS
jgi:hypothetical protein